MLYIQAFRRERINFRQSKIHISAIFAPNLQQTTAQKLGVSARFIELRRVCELRLNLPDTLLVVLYW